MIGIINAHERTQYTEELLLCTPMAEVTVDLVVEYLDPQAQKIGMGKWQKIAHTAMGIFTCGIANALCIQTQNQRLLDAVKCGDEKSLKEAEEAISWGASSAELCPNTYRELAEQNRFRFLNRLICQIDFSTPWSAFIKELEDYLSPHFVGEVWDQRSFKGSSYEVTYVSSSKKVNNFVTALLLLAVDAFDAIYVTQREKEEREQDLNSLKILLELFLRHHPVLDCDFVLADGAKMTAIMILYHSLLAGELDILKLFIKYKLNPKSQFPTEIFSRDENRVMPPRPSLLECNTTLPFVKFWVEEVGIDPKQFSFLLPKDSAEYLNGCLKT